MSFARSLSNPEGLYVYHDVGGWIQFYGGGLGMEGLRIPPDIWYKALDKYDWYCLDRIDYRGLTIEDIIIPTERPKEEQGELHRLMGPPKDFKTRLFYGEKEIIMWNVTWWQILNASLEHINTKRRTDVVRKIRDDILTYVLNGSRPFDNLRQQKTNVTKIIKRHL